TSPSATTGPAASPAVSKLLKNGNASGLPAASVMLPVTLTVSGVPAGHSVAGVSAADRPSGATEIAAGNTAAPARTKNVVALMLAASIASLKYAVTAFGCGTPVAPSPGSVLSTDSATASKNTATDRVT